MKPGANVGLGKDDTLYALIDGIVKFEGFKRTRRVSVYPAAPAEPAAPAVPTPEEAAPAPAPA